MEENPVLDLFQQTFVNALVEMAFQPRVDSYGNTLPSSLDALWVMWWDRNRAQVIEQVVAKIDVDAMAEKIAHRMEDVITTKASSFNWNEPERREIEKLVREKIAERIAARVVIPGDAEKAEKDSVEQAG